MKQLTRRQQEFLGRFWDLYCEERDALHYSAVARRLGVSNVSAYEMLRLLEQRGFVEPIYQLPKLRGPGRATVSFLPTASAARLFGQLADGDLRTGDWETTKERIFRQLEASKEQGYDALLNELLCHLPEQPSSLIFGGEMIVAIILLLCGLQDQASSKELLSQLNALVVAADWQLNTLAGLCLGLSAVEHNRPTARLLLTHVERLQTAIAGLGVEGYRQLTAFTQRTLQIIGQ